MYERSPAPPAGLARMWSLVSAAHRVIAKRREYFWTTPVEDRLAEQLGMIGFLHDWKPTSSAEVAALSAMLHEYAGGEVSGPRDHTAARVVAYVRAMAGSRARSDRGAVGGSV